jgi:hypothetical protein
MRVEPADTVIAGLVAPGDAAATAHEERTP